MFPEHLKIRCISFYAQFDVGSVSQVVILSVVYFHFMFSLPWIKRCGLNVSTFGTFISFLLAVPIVSMLLK